MRGLLRIPEVLGSLGLFSRGLEREGWNDTGHCKKCLSERMSSISLGEAGSLQSFFQVSASCHLDSRKTSPQRPGETSA